MPDPIKYKIPIHTVRQVLSANELEDRIGYQISDYDLEPLWPKLDHGENICIAVIDSGVSKYHAEKGDLKGAIVDIKNFTTDRSWDDGNGHGTHTASTMGATLSNYGIAGIGPRFQVMVIKALNNAGFGDSRGLSQAIVYAVDNGAHIINGSFGSRGADPIIAEAVNYAEDKEVLQFYAGGNDGRDNSVGFPARHQYGIATGAIDRAMNLAHFSSRGPQIKVVGPGVDIYAAYRGQEFASLDGTSMACPCVASYFGLLLQAEYMVYGHTVTHSHAAATKKIQQYSIDLGPQGRDAGYGYGALNARQMIEDVLKQGEAGGEPTEPIDGESEDIELLGGTVKIKR